MKARGKARAFPFRHPGWLQPVGRKKPAHDALQPAAPVNTCEYNGRSQTPVGNYRVRGPRRSVLTNTAAASDWPRPDPQTD